MKSHMPDGVSSPQPAADEAKGMDVNHKNWLELIKPNKLEVNASSTGKNVATVTRH